MKKAILVPIDGSKRSLAVLPFAIQLAKACGDEIILLNVHGTAQILGEALLKEAVSIVEQERVPYQAKVRIGNPTTEISSEARNDNIRCIVMGFKGAGMNQEGKVLGSVSSGILQLSPCPVTLVPNQ